MTFLKEVSESLPIRMSRRRRRVSHYLGRTYLANLALAVVPMNGFKGYADYV